MYSLLAIYAASALKAVDLYQDPQFFLKKQFIAVLCGYLIIFILYRIPFQWISHLTIPLTVFAILALGAVFVPGM